MKILRSTLTLFLCVSLAAGVLFTGSPVLADETDPAAEAAENAAAENSGEADEDAAGESKGAEAEPADAADVLNSAEEPELIEDPAASGPLGTIRIDLSSRLYINGSFDVRAPIPEADSLNGDMLMGAGVIDPSDAPAEPDREGAEAAIYEAIRGHADSVDLSPYSLPLDEIPDIYVHVINTNGDLFYAGSIIEIDPDSGVLNLEYIDWWYPAEAQKVLDNTVDTILEKVDSRWSDEEKLLFIHDYLIDHAEYDYSYSRHSAYHLLVEHTAVCQGYAAAFNLLVKKLGITVDVITSDEINHAWNLVKVNGEYYYIDVTWDDPGCGIEGPVAMCTHENFLREKEAFSGIHYDSTDWMDSDSHSVYTSSEFNTGNAYENAYWLKTDGGIDMSMAAVGRQWAYHNPGGYYLYVHDYTSGTDSTLCIPYFEGIYGVASDGSSWYIVTSKKAYRVTAEGDLTELCAHTSEELSKYNPRGLEVVGDRIVWTWIGYDGNTRFPAAYGSCPITDNPSSNGGESAQNIWTFKDGVLTVSGSQSMANWSKAEKVPWAAYASQITKAVIEDGVTSVGSYAFAGCTNLKTIELGKTVAFLGDHAFDGCTDLTSYTIPDTVTEIGRYTFANTGLKTIEISKNVVSIYGSSFGKIQDITISDQNETYYEIDGDIYYDSGNGYDSKQFLALCNKTVPGEYEVNPDTIAIDYDAFACADIWSVILPDITWEIYPYAFGDTVKNVILPDSSEANNGPYFIYDYAFMGFSGNIYYKGTEGSFENWKESYYRPDYDEQELYIHENNEDFLGAGWFFDYSLAGITTTETASIVSGETHAPLPAYYDPDLAAAVDTSVSYLAADPGIVRVNEDGTLTGLKKGETIVYVRAAGRCAECLVKVVGDRIGVVSVSVSPESLSLKIGESAQIKAEVLPADATNPAVTWESSDTSVATVSDTGIVTGKKEGTVTITVTTVDGGFKAVSEVTVLPETIEVTGVAVYPSTLKLLVGEEASLKAVVSPSNATDKSVTWSSSDDDVASVDENGKVTANGLGTADITVTTVSGNKTAVCPVTIEDEFVDVDGVDVSPYSLMLEVGQSEILEAFVSPENATNRTVIWESKDSSVATVDDSGKVTAVKAGETEIWGYSYNRSRAGICYVTVMDPGSAIPVQGVYFEFTSYYLETWESVQLEPVIYPEEADNKNVIWSSSRPEVATVDQDGYVTARATGRTTITVTTEDGGYTDDCMITVGDFVDVWGLEVRPNNLAMEIGQSQVIQVFISPEDATYRSVTWESSDPSVASVDANGKVTANKVGGAIITAFSYDGCCEDTCLVTVKKKGSVVRVTGVELDRTSYDMTAGESIELEAVVTPANADNRDVIWSSSEPDVASVDQDGCVEANTAGEAMITVTTIDGGFTASCLVTVSELIDVLYLEVHPRSLVLEIGQSQVIKAVIMPENASYQSVTWESTDPSVASVDANGKVTAKKAGEAKITAFSYDRWCWDSCYVTVKDPQSVIHVEKVEVDPTSVTLEEGDWCGIEVIITPSDADNQEVTWTSSDPSVAYIDEDGDIMAAGPGKAILTVKTEDGGKTATCQVTVTEMQDEPDERTYISLAGDNRYATAVTLAKQAFPQPPKEIIIVKSTDFPDALSANAYAGAANAPVLLSSLKGLSQEVKDLLAKTWGGKVTKATFIGGGFSAQVEKDLKACGIKTIEKLAGNNRYETAEAVMRAGFDKNYFANDTVIVATGQKAADALSVSPWSYRLHYPMLLATSKLVLPDSSMALLKEKGFKRVILLGNVSDSCAAGLPKTRLMGNTRYETSLRIADYFINQENAGSYQMSAFAMGYNKNFPDALAAGMVFGKLGAPVILVKNVTASDRESQAIYNFCSWELSDIDLYDTFYFVGAAARGKENSSYNAIIRAIES